MSRQPLSPNIMSTYDYRFRFLLVLTILSVLSKSHGFHSSALHGTNIQGPSRRQNGRPSLQQLHVVETEAPVKLDDSYSSTTTRSPSERVISDPFPSVLTTDDERNFVYGSEDILPAFSGISKLNTSSQLIEMEAANDTIIIGSATDESLDSSMDESDQHVTSNENSQNSAQNESSESDDEKSMRLEQTAKAAKILSHRKSTSSSKKATTSARTKTTSVGARRVGSATKARGMDRSMTRLVDAVRTGTSVGSVTPHSKPNDSSPIETTRKKSQFKDTNGDEKITSLLGPSTSSSRALIEAAVEDMLKWTEPTMGVLGEPVRSSRVVPRPKPGTVLIKSKKPNKDYHPLDTTITVRVAKPADDLDIANLRLSVFSDFTPETRKVFCDRSCHLLSARRQRGAACLVATQPSRTGTFMSSTLKDPVIGTAEISFHEFIDTRLGRSRPVDSIMYVTEVAVSSRHRRKGIAKLMMHAIDKVAEIRNTETIYLHVDVDNKAALRLYERAGYKKLASDNPVLLEFTTKLNLHDGATKGRKHFLMAKDIRKPTWLEDIDNIKATTQQATLGIEVLQ